MKHTPGPWDVVFGELEGNGEFSVYAPEDGTICRGDNEMINWKENAILIASAPDLLEACELALNFLDDLLLGKIPTEHRMAEMEKASKGLYQAIDKAKTP